MPETTCTDCNGEGWYTLDNLADIAICDHMVPADVIERVQEHHAFLEELARRIDTADRETVRERRPSVFQMIVWGLHPEATLTDEQWAHLDSFEFQS